jgi:cell division protease FtsH
MRVVGHWLHQVAQLALDWLPLAFFVLTGLIVYLLWRTLQVMPRTSPTHLEPGSRSAVTWDDVAGVDEAQAELQEVVDFLRHPKRFERLGARVPKGILLYGPPGTGKTLLAKAIAHESGAAFYSQSASAFVEMFAGLGASRIRKLFAEARKHAPSIVFIDEFAPSDQVVVMGASNRLQDLDPALLRPGRFDRQMLVAPPDLAGREQILGVHTRSKPLAGDVDLPQIARQTAGLTGADLANIANEAAIFAGRRQADSIIGRDFDNAIDRIVGGLQQRRVLTEKERRILAYHEAGHALMSYLMGAAAPVQKVTIVSRGNALGYTLHLSEEDRYMETKEELVDLMKIALAGRAAEQIVFGRVTNGAASDLEKATEIARSMVFEWGMSEIVTSRTLRADNYALSEETKRLRDHEQARLTDEAYAEALRLIAKHRAPLDRMARALLEKETLVRDEVLQLLGGVEPESHASETVGMPVVVAVPAD